MFFSKKIKKSKITSERAKELLIDLQEPKTKEEKEYINKLINYAKEDGLDFYSKEYLEERKEIAWGWRKSELRAGAQPKNKKEEQWVKEYNEYQEKSKKEDEDYEKREKAIKEEILALLKKYNYTDYLPGHKFNNYIFNKRYEKISKKATIQGAKKCIEKYGKVDTGTLYEESLLIKQKLLKEKYGYDWCPQGDNYCQEFWDEYNAIRKKYNAFSNYLDRFNR